METMKSEFTQCNLSTFSAQKQYSAIKKTVPHVKGGPTDEWKIICFLY